MKVTHFLLVGAVIALVMGGVSFMKGKVSSQGALQLYSWSSYFTEEMLADFTRETGVPVEISYFSSNEELLAKMVAGASGYDVIIPSDYMISRMLARGMLLPLDHRAIPHLTAIDDFYRELPYDKGLKYSVPFGRGHTGILINTQRVTVPKEGVSWDMVLNSPDPKRTSLLDDMREVFALGLMRKGFSPNTRDAATLKTVSDALQKSKRQIAMFSSEPVALLLKGELAIAHGFSTHAAQVIRENKNFEFFYPKEGAIVWTDNYAIPKGAKHPVEAHQFINFMLDPARTAKCTELSGLAAASRAARELLPSEVKNIEYLYPNKETEKRLQFLDDLIGQSLSLMNRLWTEMKSS